MLIASLSRRGIRSSILSSSGTPAAPVNTSLPTIDNTTPAQGDTLAGSNGTWTGAPTFTYQWTSGGIPIGGATSNTYVVQNSDVGNVITFQVTGTNGGGSAMAESAATQPVDSGLPVNTVAPVITSTGDINNPVNGDVLTVTDNGTWTGTPTIVYTYAWFRDVPSGTFGDTSQSHTVNSDPLEDFGRQLGCNVIATNAAGNTSAASNTTGVVT